MRNAPTNQSNPRQEVDGSLEAPLLGDAAHNGGESSYGSIDDGSRPDTQSQRPEITRLPLGQISLLAYMRIATPLVDTQSLPYINEMMLRVGAAKNPAQVGYYSGLVQSTFALVQAVTVLKTGIFADQFGRKPVIIVSLTGIVVFVISFGLSRTFAWALITRALAGTVAGNGMLINNAAADITDETNQAQAYAIIGLSLNVAQVIGPFIGGTFADPQDTFPDTLGAVALFRTFPYLLPCVITGLIIFGALVLCVLFFKETAESMLEKQRLSKAQAAFEPSDAQQVSPKPSAWEIALEPTLFSVLCTFFMLNLINTAGSTVFILFAYTSIDSGGLSRSPAEIGFIVSSSGVIAAIIEVFAIGILQRRLGTVRFIRWTMAMWPFIFCSYPFLNAVARVMIDDDAGDVQAAPAVGALFWVVVAGHLTLQRVASMSYPLGLILTKNAAPSKTVMGTVFGLGQLVACVARTLAVSFVSSLFAFSKEHNVLAGNLVWVVMTVVSLLGTWSAVIVRDGLAQ